MDKHLGLNINTIENMLNWGVEEFNNPIKNCQNRFLKPIIRAIKNLTELFVTPPESGDNRFIHLQPCCHRLPAHRSERSNGTTYFTFESDWRGMKGCVWTLNKCRYCQSL